jgi:hypothetical protein
MIYPIIAGKRLSASTKQEKMNAGRRLSSRIFIILNPSI